MISEIAAHNASVQVAVVKQYCSYLLAVCDILQLAIEFVPNLESKMGITFWLSNNNKRWWWEWLLADAAQIDAEITLF